MQSVGLQTVLQMSNMAERAQTTAQSNTPLAAEQAKESVIKKAEEMKDTVHETANTEGKIIKKDEEKEEGRKRRENEHREGVVVQLSEEQQATELKPIMPNLSAASHGGLLNIKA